jgi:hypothetical protein
MFRSRHPYINIAETIVISDDSSISDSSDSDDPISKGARAAAVKHAADRLAADQHAAAYRAALDSVLILTPPQEQPSRCRHIRIRDSDDDDDAAMDSTRPELTAKHADYYNLTASRTQCDDVPSAVTHRDEQSSAISAHDDLPEALRTVDQPLHCQPSNDTKVAAMASSRQKLHEYFSRFAACQNSTLEIEPEPAPGAEVMDLRQALPEVFPVHLYDLESAHVGADSNDTSGHTNSEVESEMSEFVDDSVVMTAAETEYLLKYAKRMLPLTVKSMKKIPALLLGTPKRKRVISSSSSTSPASAAMR